jgi:hypothetical protein
MTRLTVFDVDALRALKADHDRLERTLEGMWRRLAGMRCELQRDTGFMVVKLSGSVTARAGTTPGTGSGTVYRYDGSDLVTTGQLVTVKNAFASTSGSAGAYVLCSVDDYGTVWVTSEDCP